MKARRLSAGTLALAVLAASAAARAPAPLPVLDDKPTPQIDALGPSAAVMALAFADGETLTGAGLDKVVRVWALREGRFVLKTAYRVPVGPGNAGAVNAVAVSPDGTWVAIAGRAPIRGEAGFRQGGVVLDAAALSAEQSRDAGLVYVANTANPAGGKVLRGHRGEVRALAFAPAAAGKPPLLVSAATERDGGREFGGLRLWDVAAGKSLAERDDLPALKTRPGLAVWHTGPGATAVRVVVAWPDAEDATPGSLQLWDPAPGADPMQKWKADGFPVTAALLGRDGGRVLTGGSSPAGRRGRLQAWDFSPDRDTRADAGTVAEFPRRENVDYRPVALSVVAGGDSEAPRYAAVVLQPSLPGDFHLALVDLQNRRVAADLPLSGSDGSRLPAIAANGRHVAVAAWKDHAVRVYALDDLRDGKTRPAAVLAGDGLSLRHVAFVEKGSGLWLSDDGRARQLEGGLLFDLAGRRLRANDAAAPAGDAPDLDGWSWTVDPDRQGVRLRQGDKELPPIRLRGKGEEVTAVALRPPAAGMPGVLAVAYTERDSERTLVMLCDPAEGKPYRLLVGHLQDVRGLAFSASRPLLASVGDDQTACVWSLTDLDAATGEVPGLRVGDGTGGRVVVRKVEPGSAAARAGLAAGDVLEKVGPPGAAKPVGDASDFLLAVSTRRPGDAVEVTVGGKGVVKLPVGRGVDQRKPLFSLFLARGRGLPEWVGWSPAGPYDFSAPRAERHLGWHTNTGDPANPVSFAAASAYRKEYRREGILRYLAAEADLGRALRKWDADHPVVPPRPSLRPVRPDGAEFGEQAGEYLVRQAVPALRVGINDDYALDDKHVLTWRLTHSDGGNAAAEVAAGTAVRDLKEWQADLSRVQWRRGQYRLRFALHARADGPEVASEAVVLRFQPPAPRLALLSGGKPARATERDPMKSAEERLELSIAVQAPAGQEVELQFSGYRNGTKLPPEVVPAARLQTGSGTVQQAFELQEGLNRLVFRAVNREALAGHEAEESDAAEVWVSYKAPHESLPRFTGLRLEPEPVVERSAGDELWVVDRPAARLTGKVEAEGVLVQADWAAGGAPKSLVSAGESSGAEFAIDLKLKAGEVEDVRLRAKSRHSDEKVETRRVVFRPGLPAVRVGPTEGPDLLKNKVTLKGAVWPATDDPFELRVRVTGEKGDTAAFDAKVDRKAGVWTAEVTLFPGTNAVETVVSNKWRGERLADRPLSLRYRRPPRLANFPEKVVAVETNRVSLPLTVEGPSDRPITAVTVDGRPVAHEIGKPEVTGGQARWQVRLPELFVNDGERNLDQVTVRAVTDEGESAPVVIRVGHARIPRPPRARFVSPAAVDTAKRPEYRVEFRVESERPLERVEIRRGDEVIYKADVTRAVREGALATLQGKADLALVNGANRLELVAVNADGRSPRAEVVVSYTEPAVLITVDRVELRSEKGDVEATLTPVCDPSCEVRFSDPAPRGLVWLAGHVRWNDPRAKQLDDPGLAVVARVADVRQFPVALGPRGTGEEANARPFHVPLVLIGPENRVAVDVPSVSQQEQSRREFTLRCLAPVRKQRLHLLIVGVDVRDGERLARRFLDALAVDERYRPAGLQGEFVKNPPFEQCVLYRVLTGEVERGKVEAQLVEINKEITRLKNRTGWLNDLVLIYYQGQDLVDNRQRHWLKTSRNLQFPNVPPEEFAIPVDELPRVPGAELLLVNATGPAQSLLARGEKDDPGLGFIRYLCTDSAEASRSDPLLLRLLQEAMQKKSTLGEVKSYVNDLLNLQKGKFGAPVAIVDPDLERRRLNEPVNP